MSSWVSAVWDWLMLLNSGHKTTLRQSAGTWTGSLLTAQMVLVSSHPGGGPGLADSGIKLLIRAQPLPPSCAKVTIMPGPQAMRRAKKLSLEPTQSRPIEASRSVTQRPVPCVIFLLGDKVKLLRGTMWKRRSSLYFRGRQTWVQISMLLLIGYVI